MNPFNRKAAEQLGGIEVIECETLELAGSEEEYNLRLEMLKARGKIVEMTAEDREKIQRGEWFRVGGDVICDVCEKPYRDHPILHQYAILHKMCDGMLGKL